MPIMALDPVPTQAADREWPRHSTILRPVGWVRGERRGFRHLFKFIVVVQRN